MKRARFLIGSVGGIVVAANAGHVFARALAQTPLPGLPGSENRCLILLNLQGGNDGLNCVVPHGNSDYYRVRPSLAIPQSEVLAIDARLGFSPSMTSLKGMYDKGLVAVVQGVGYPNPDHSHFRSTEIWQTAAPDRYEHTGWIGRYLDAAGLPATNLFNGIALSAVLPEVMVGTKIDVPAIASEAAYGLRVDRDAPQAQAYADLVRDPRLPFSSPYLPHVMEIEDRSQRGSEELPKLISGYRTNASYPATPLGRSLALAAQIVGSKIGTRVIYVQHGSFDTHVNQLSVQNRLLGEFSDAMKAFYDDLGAHGLDRSVLTVTFSEFGRRVEENGSHGTDHGEGSPLFLIGGSVNGGIYGQAPDLPATNMGNVRFTTDFRSVYATVLERWLGRPSAPVLNGTFEQIRVIA